jgi:hypothetical protein
MVSPPLFSLGLRIRLSSSVNIDGGKTTPRNISLLWLTIVGSVNAKQIASFGSTGLENKSDEREILLADAGSGTVLFSSNSHNSWLNGFRTNPKKQEIFEISLSERQNLSLTYSSFDVTTKEISLLNA